VEYDSDYDELDIAGDEKLEDKIYYGSDTSSDYVRGNGSSSEDEFGVQKKKKPKRKGCDIIYEIKNPFLDHSSEEEEEEDEEEEK
jgi:hypothetical protein